jgi:hypothetical protein
VYRRNSGGGWHISAVVNNARLHALAQAGVDVAFRVSRHSGFILPLIVHAEPGLFFTEDGGRN